MSKKQPYRNVLMARPNDFELAKMDTASRAYHIAKAGGSVQPSRSDVHINQPLSNISLAFLQDASNFVADRVFPNVPVSKQSDAYFTYDRGNFNRDEMQMRAPGTESEGSGYGVANDTYYAAVRALHRNIPDQVRANADNPINLDREATLFLTHKALINREVNWVARYFPNSHAPGDVWTFDVDGAGSATAAGSFDPTSAGNNDKVYWDDASSTPIEDVRQGKRFVLEETGFEPNTLTLGRAVYDALLDHPDIIGRLDRGQTSGPARAQRDSLAALFEVDQILVMDAIQNTANEGATNAHSFIGGKNALLTYSAPTPSLMTPSAGYTFGWTGLLGSNTFGMRIKRFRMDALESDRVEIDNAYDHKLVAADLGYYFGGIVE